MKTIVISDVRIKEVQIIPEPPSMNVRYALTDAQGNEYKDQWRTFKGNRISNVLDRITKIAERAIEKVKEDEGL